MVNNLPPPHGLPTDLGLSARQVRWSIGAGQLSSSPQMVQTSNSAHTGLSHLSAEWAKFPLLANLQLG